MSGEYQQHHLIITISVIFNTECSIPFFVHLVIAAALGRSHRWDEPTSRAGCEPVRSKATPCSWVAGSTPCDSIFLYLEH